MPVGEDLLAGALSGAPEIVRRFVDEMTPIVQARVVRGLLRRRGAALGRDLRQEVADLTQEVFVSLFDDGGRALRAYRAERGLSLPNYIGLLAERQVASIMRSGRRSPFTEEPTIDDELHDAFGAGPALDTQLASRELLERLLDRLRASLTPKGLQLFRLLYVEERSVEEICTETAMRPDAVYAWRSRIGKLVRSLAAELEPDSSKRPAPPRPFGEEGAP
jgi:RNA polymerase sigma factor (sigma-70 family)